MLKTFEIFEMLAPRKSRIFGGSFFPQLAPKPSFAATDTHRSTWTSKSNSLISGIYSSRRSKLKENPKLIFDYGPDAYKGLVAHRKIKIASIAEYIQLKYPDIDVFYHPVADFDLLTVRLQNSVIFTSKLSKLDRSPSGSATKKIEDALTRLSLYPDLIRNPFRDPMTLMTHNLDIDYEYPWYRTPIGQMRNLKHPENRQRVLFGSSIVGQCQVKWDMQTSLWNKFLDKIEASPDFENLLQDEFFAESKIPTFRPGKATNLETSSTI